MTSKPSRVSGVYGLLTLKCRVLLTVRVSLHVKSSLDVFLGGWPELLGTHSFTGICLPKANGISGAGPGCSACLELKRALGGKSKELAVEAEGKAKYGSPACAFERCVCCEHTQEGLAAASPALQPPRQCLVPALGEQGEQVPSALCQGTHL